MYRFGSPDGMIWYFDVALLFFLGFLQGTYSPSPFHFSEMVQEAKLRERSVVMQTLQYRCCARDDDRHDRLNIRSFTERDRERYMRVWDHPSKRRIWCVYECG